MKCTIFHCKKEGTHPGVVRPSVSRNVTADRARKFEVEVSYCDEHAESQIKNLPDTLELSLNA